MTDEEKLKKAYSNTIQDNPKYSKNLYSPGEEKKKTRLELAFALLLCFFVIFAILLLILNNYLTNKKAIKALFITDAVLTVAVAVATIVISIRDGNRGLRGSRIKFAMCAAFLSVPIVAVLGILLFESL